MSARPRSRSRDLAFDGWVWPMWLEHQLDPASPAYVADQRLPVVANVTARNATIVANLDSAVGATVDPRGLVTPGLGAVGWSLDWWVGGDDRWHLPSREAAVRQRLVDDAPVVETAMRVPGGDVVQRAYAVRTGGEELAVVEVDNRSPAPVALALVIRPVDGSGLGAVRQVAMAGDTTVVVDGRAALLLPRRPNRMATASGPFGDVVSSVLGGTAGDGFVPVDDDTGLGTAAFLWPLPHRTLLRVALPLTPSRVRARRRGLGRRPAVVGAPAVGSLPAAEQVARGWKVHAGRGLRLVLPDDRLASAVAAVRSQLLAGAGRPVEPSVRTTTWLPGALDRYGYGEESATALGRHDERLRLDGGLGDGEVDGAHLHALVTHWRLGRDRAWVAGQVPAVAALAEGLGRPPRGGRPPASPGWRRRGLLAAAELLAAAGEERAAADATRAAGQVAAEHPEVTAAPEDGWPGGPVTNGRSAEDADGTAVMGRGDHGLDLRATVERALAETDGGGPAALVRLRWLLDAATGTWTWPSFVHPRLRTGSSGEPHDLTVAAGVAMLIRQLLVRETADGLALVSGWPDEWLGQGLEVHDAPTARGRLSCAVRWHGDRPALLWEVVLHDGVVGVTLTAPGLDPGWSSTALSGEALLAPVAVPAVATRVGLSPRRR